MRSYQAAETSNFFVSPLVDQAGVLWFHDQILAAETAVAHDYGLTFDDVLKASDESVAGVSASQEIMRGIRPPHSEENSEIRAREVISYSVGCVFGRWDIGFATGDKSDSRLPDLFDPLPVCSVGVLQGSDRLPASRSPEDYPLEIDWDGILVDDPDRPDDIIRGVSDALEVIWKDRPTPSRRKLARSSRPAFGITASRARVASG